MNPKIEANRMTLSIERRVTHVTLNGKKIKAVELGISLPFAYKAANLHAVKGGDMHRVFVIETITVGADVFDVLSADLLWNRDWLAGKGGICKEGGRCCVEIVAPNRPVLYIDTSGYDYPRYVARLG